MIVLTKSQANKLIANSLFTKGGTLSIAKIPYCTGKYNKGIIGRELNSPENLNILHVFAEARSDKEGSYYKLRYLK